ncbi:MAG: hypothetical protein O9306_12315 [Beijerinckiaceae bacterium]|jgi:Holliday junction resolvase|nr:hypothetical protein [Beijerinckiaceae bacterium]
MIQHHPDRSGADLRRKFVRRLAHNGSIVFGSWSLRQTRSGSLLGFDVKAKTVYRGQIFFDVEEVRRLANFGQLFNVSIYFACLQPPWRRRLVGLGA